MQEFTRKQFTFYGSYLDGIEELPEEEQGTFVLAIIKYALRGIEPQCLSPMTRMAFKLIKPTLDASRRKAEANTRESKEFPQSNQEETDRKLEDNCEVTVSTSLFKGEKERENKKESKKEKESKNKSEIKIEDNNTNVTINDKGLAEVMDYFLNKINPTAPPYVLDKIKFYYQQMGVDCCKRAFDIALAERKTSWSYIDTILKNKLSQGVKCLADWEESDKKHEDGKRAKAITKNPGKATAQDFQPTDDEIQENNDWLEKFLDENDPGWRESNKERFGI